MAKSVSNGNGPSRSHLSRDAREIAEALCVYMDVPTAAAGEDDQFNELVGNRLDSALMGLQRLLDGGTVNDFIAFIAAMTVRFPADYRTDPEADGQ